MNDQTKIILLGTLLGISVISLAILSLSLWDLKKNRGLQESEKYSLSSQLLPAPWSQDWDSWGTSSAIPDLHNRMDAMINQVLSSGSLFDKNSFGVKTSAPEVKMAETDDAFEIEVSVPEGDDVELNTALEDNILTITGKAKNASENYAGNLQRKRIATSQFSHSITLPKPIDEPAMTIENKGEKVVIRVPKKYS